jgi:hypothetical protein
MPDEAPASMIEARRFQYSNKNGPINANPENRCLPHLSATPSTASSGDY